MTFDENNIPQTGVAVATNEEDQVVTLPVLWDCVYGHELSVETPVTVGTVEFRHGDSGAWSSDTDVIDETPYAGQRELFQIRLTAPGTITEHLIASTRFRSGPPIVVPVYSYVYNDDLDEVYNDEDELVLVEV